MNLPLNIDLQQILLHLLNFTLLFAIFYLLLYKPVKKFMEDRSNYYKEMDEKAKKDLETAEKTKEKYLQQLENIEKEIDEKNQVAHRQSEELSEQMLRQAREEADNIIAKAKEEASRERTKIINSASDEISDMVTAATARMLYSDTAEAYDRFLDSAEGSGKDA